jgi:hypothetical protein
MTPEELKTSAAWIGAIGKAWRDGTMRARYEAETGLATPANPASLEFEAQAQSGHLERYHFGFTVWAARKLGIEKQAPSQFAPFFDAAWLESFR